MYKKIIKIGLLASIGLSLSFHENSFKSRQLQYKRVKIAYQNTWMALQKEITDKKINKNQFDLYLRGFKQEAILEVWIKNTDSKQYSLLKTYAICASSGTPGPKRRQGDGQVPEGFYEIASFQPQSNYHLALKVGYPNKSDRIKARSADPGGDIMIHGNCVTIGCIPIQDEPIEELYVLCVEAKNHGSVIFTDIYPFKFTEQNKRLCKQNRDQELVRFWNSLKPAYDLFEKSRVLARVKIDTKGNYNINPNGL